MKQQNKERSRSAIAALLLFGLFAIGILAVLLGGAGVYGRLTQRNGASYHRRTCTQYVATKLRQASSPEAVVVAAFGQADALVISQTIDGEEYLTRVYCYDGWLRELFAIAGGDFAPEDGEKILPLADLSLSCNGTLVEASFIDTNGGEWDLTLHIRGNEGVQP